MFGFCSGIMDIISEKYGFEGRINGYYVGQNQISGLKHRLVKLLMNKAEWPDDPDD